MFRLYAPQVSAAIVMRADSLYVVRRRTVTNRTVTLLQWRLAHGSRVAASPRFWHHPFLQERKIPAGVAMKERSLQSAVPAEAFRTRRRWHFGRSVLDERTCELMVDGVDAELERKPLEVL